MDLEALLLQKRELERYAGELQEVKTMLFQYRERLRACWDADEMDQIAEALERMRRDTRRMAEDLNEIGYLMIKAYEELQKDEM